MRCKFHYTYFKCDDVYVQLLFLTSTIKTFPKFCVGGQFVRYTYAVIQCSSVPPPQRRHHFIHIYATIMAKFNRLPYCLWAIMPPKAGNSVQSSIGTGTK
ncbi:hypothetical protein NQ317_017039 [Molorchus minor]|uniref:Uncharacterized protein n=1 Tax=Molorchus minor TaxID=1323400 RepID=A0ABQ9K4Y4_9CUCU|nr:hypothetical protein NQ317_017039 [Molorchus minor]